LNICHFIDAAVDRYAVTEHDRFSQMFELVFDLSLFDLFVAWERGACVCCPDQGDALLPARFIVESGISIWFSVPSLAVSMRRLGMLEAGLYPGLRISLFCGEALLTDIAEQWSTAAPNSVIENLYGPTEVTLACTWYHWDPRQSPAESEHGIVPIGDPFPGMTALVVDEDLREVPPGQSGELLMSGPQVVPGYWNDPQKTGNAFVIPPEKDTLYYRTGDLVRQPSSGQPLKYLGRIDQQIKIRGNRVELGEIEAVLRDAAGVDIVVAVGWPITPAGADGIVAFIGSSDVDLDHVRELAKRRLPPYMLPREIRLTDDIPLNPNGKIDRKALIGRLTESK
jgi:non-ribosomal peptide synthetase component F